MTPRPSSVVDAQKNTKNTEYCTCCNNYRRRREREETRKEKKKLLSEAMVAAQSVAWTV